MDIKVEATFTSRAPSFADEKLAHVESGRRDPALRAARTSATIGPSAVPAESMSEYAAKLAVGRGGESARPSEDPSDKTSDLENKALGAGADALSGDRAVDPSSSHFESGEAADPSVADEEPDDAASDARGNATVPHLNALDNPDGGHPDHAGGGDVVSDAAAADQAAWDALAPETPQDLVFTPDGGSGAGSEMGNRILVYDKHTKELLAETVVKEDLSFSFEWDSDVHAGIHDVVILEADRAGNMSPPLEMRVAVSEASLTALAIEAADPMQDDQQTLEIRGPADHPYQVRIGDNVVGKGVFGSDGKETVRYDADHLAEGTYNAELVVYAYGDTSHTSEPVETVTDQIAIGDNIPDMAEEMAIALAEALDTADEDYVISGDDIQLDPDALRGKPALPVDVRWDADAAKVAGGDTEDDLSRALAELEGLTIDDAGKDAPGSVDHAGGVTHAYGMAPGADGPGVSELIHTPEDVLG